MKQMRKLSPFLLLAVMSGWATLPSGPSVNVLPARGKSFAQFRTEDGTCRQWAERQVENPPQDTYQNDVAKGAVAGTAVGAGLGAALGSVSSNAGAGALIGAVGGLFVGTAVGSNAGEEESAQAQRSYDNAYVQCMYSHGNLVPGRQAVVAPPPQAAAPPPPNAGAPPDYAGAPPGYAGAPPDYAVAPPAPTADYYAAPPEVYVTAAPQFIYSPAMNMYVAVGVPYDLVYDGRDYFYSYGGRWYRGPYYDGPWAYVPRRSYPPAFATYRVGDIRRYREAEYLRYQRDREHFDGRFHRPAYRERRLSRHRD